MLGSDSLSYSSTSSRLEAALACIVFLGTNRRAGRRGAVVFFLNIMVCWMDCF